MPLAADATDPDGSVALVEFFAGSVKVGEDASAPYAAAWTGAAPGAYVLTARVTDESGATAVSAPVTDPRQLAAGRDAQLARARRAVRGPGDGASGGQRVRPDGTIAQVEFFANGTPLGVDTTSPYTRDLVERPRRASTT